jgi:hypothetical protein
MEKSWGGVFFVHFFGTGGWERSPILFFLFLNYIACIIVYNQGFFFKGFCEFFFILSEVVGCDEEAAARPPSYCIHMLFRCPFSSSSGEDASS